MTDVMTEAFLPSETKPTPLVVAPPVPTRWREGVRLVGKIDPKGPISLAVVQKWINVSPEHSAKHFLLDSEGGCIAEAFRIFEALRSLPVPIAATAIHVCSAALVIYAAADLRIAAPDTAFLLHGQASARRICRPD